MTAWYPVASNVVELLGPYILLGWAWGRWVRDPYRSSFPRWRDLLVLLALLLATTGAALYAFYLSGHMHPRPVPGHFHRWPLTYANGMLYALLGGLALSMVSRGFLRFLLSVGCLWMTVLALLAWRIPQDYLDSVIDALDRNIRG